MGRPGLPELLLILLVVLLLFGAKRLPDLSRSVGRSLRILKAETKALHDDGDDQDQEERPAPAERPRAELAAPREEPAAPPATGAGSSVRTDSGDTR
jgi:sec-independent protein translocase protein TatA